MELIAARPWGTNFTFLLTKSSPNLQTNIVARSKTLFALHFSPNRTWDTAMFIIIQHRVCCCPRNTCHVFFTMKFHLYQREQFRELLIVCQQVRTMFFCSVCFSLLMSNRILMDCCWHNLTFFYSSLRLQKRLAASVMGCGKKKVWLDPNENNEISNTNSSEYFLRIFSLKTFSSVKESWNVTMRIFYKFFVSFYSFCLSTQIEINFIQ